MQLKVSIVWRQHSGVDAGRACHSVSAWADGAADPEAELRQMACSPHSKHLEKAQQQEGDGTLIQRRSRFCSWRQYLASGPSASDTRTDAGSPIAKDNGHLGLRDKWESQQKRV